MLQSIALTLIMSFAVKNTLAQNQACLAEPLSRLCEGNEDKKRMFYNTATGRCDTFLDTNLCTAGANSFSGWLTCRHACVCPLPPAQTSCDVDYPRYFFSTGSNQCELYPEGQGGCLENGNDFYSESTCKMTCVCSLQAEPGSGQGQETAYFFNTTSHRCEEFTYTGVGGNANRFATAQKCKEQCLCGMPRVVGPCYASMPRVFYNTTSGQCEEFTYGGCMGNNNNFYAMDACQSACP